MSAAAFPQEKYLRFPEPTPAENEKRLNEFSFSLISYDDFPGKNKEKFSLRTEKISLDTRMGEIICQRKIVFTI